MEPPPAAVKNKVVEPLTDEDRRTIARWIDLGCPIDLDAGRGWLMDDQRPTLSLVVQPDRLRIGAYDYAGLDESSLTVTADTPLNGVAAGTNLAGRFQRDGWIWDLSLSAPARGTITVSVKDKQGHITTIVRTVR